MWQLPSALACQAASPSCTTSPVRCTAKSMIVVVPPNAAARVPVSKVSLANVPPNGSSMWVCASIAARDDVLAGGVDGLGAVRRRCPGAKSAAIVSPSTSTSAA